MRFNPFPFCRPGVLQQHHTYGAVAFGLLCIVACVFSPQSHAIQSEAQKEVHARTVLIRGLTQLRIGFPDKAANLFAEGLSVNPDNTILLSSMADAQFAVGDVSVAIFYVEKALALKPDDYELNQQALFLFKESGDAINSVRYSSRLVTLNPNDPEIRISTLLLLNKLGMTDQAVADAEKGVLAFPHHEDVLRVALDIFLEAGSLSNAKRVASHIAELTSSPEDVFKLSKVLIQNGELDAARNLLRTLLTDEPDHELAASALEAVSAGGVSEEPSTTQNGSDRDGIDPLEEANRLFLNGEFGQAAALALAQIEVNPRQLDMWELAVRSLIEEDRLQEAIVLAEDSGLLFPGYAPLLFQHARALWRANRPGEALDRAKKALESVDPESPLFTNIQVLITQLN